MENQLETYQKDQGWDLAKKHTLIAVSGGVDSMVLCHLFLQNEYPFSIGHCNFQLRGEASNGDAVFVEQMATHYQVPCYTIDFDTIKIAQKSKESIQIAARRLRYDWLESLRKAHEMDFIATAHHLNDSIETVFYNFSKGTGIRGLHGILPTNGFLIRPLLFSTKEEILAYSKANKVEFREDASNLEDKYARNKIRHHIIPILKELNPNFERTAEENIRHIQETEAILDWALKQIQEKVVIQKGEQLLINKAQLGKFPAINSILWEMLQAFRFHPRQIRQLVEGLGQSGRCFFSKTHRLLEDRDTLVLESLKNVENITIQIEEGVKEVELPDAILHLISTEGIPENFSNSPNTAYFDASHLAFPLILRHWKEGDRFAPLGMNGKHQKLQDFFSNQKLSLFEKEKVWILETAEAEICWVVGHRLSDAFKITENTQAYFRLEYKPFY